MTNKPLILLGVVTALAMAGREANAAPCPTHPEAVSMFEHTHSCTLAGKTFDAFTFSSGVSRDTIDFANTGLVGRVTLAAPSGHNLAENFLFSYTVAASTLMEATIGNTSNTSGVVRATTHMVATSPIVIDATITANANMTRTVFTGASAPSVKVTNSNTSFAGGVLHSLTNTFTQSAPVSAPEPMSLSLFGLGLAGLALARRRR